MTNVISGNAWNSLLLQTSFVFTTARPPPPPFSLSGILCSEVLFFILSYSTYLLSIYIFPHWIPCCSRLYSIHSITAYISIHYITTCSSIHPIFLPILPVNLSPPTLPFILPRRYFRSFFPAYISIHSVPANTSIHIFLPIIPFIPSRPILLCVLILHFISTYTFIHSHQNFS